MVVVAIFIARIIKRHRQRVFQGVNRAFAHSDVFANANFDSLVR